MGIAEALSDDGKITGRGEPVVRGVITGIGTAIGGMLHTSPFLISSLATALRIAYGMVIIELIGIALIRFHFMKTPLINTSVQVIVGGGVVFAVGIWLGKLGATQNCSHTCPAIQRASRSRLTDRKTCL